MPNNAARSSRCCLPDGRIRTLLFRMEQTWRRYPVMLVVLLSFAGGQAWSADTAAGSIQGTVSLGAVMPLQAGTQYRTRTRSPILPPDTARAVVWLEPVDGGYPAAAPDSEVSIAQQGYQFRPGISAVRVGSAVRFPNQDDEFHSVFSYSQTRRFDLGRYRRGEESPAVVFDKPGVVKIYCEIHKHMRSILLVLDSPWFTVSGAEGDFRIDNVPPGRYVLKTFLPSEKTVEQQAEIRGGDVLQQDVGA